MDLGKAFVSSMLAGGRPAFMRAIEKGVNAEMLFGEGKLAFEYVVQHLQQYGEIPSNGIVLGKTGIELEPPEGNFEFFIDELLNLRLHGVLKAGVHESVKALEDRNPKQALELLEKLLLAIRSERLGTVRAESLLQLGAKVLEIYERMKKGERGIPLPWPSLNETSLGLWPQDLCLFVARLGVGKTWTMLLTAKAAWDAGKRVLVATTEMSKERMAQRFFAIDLKLPYGEFRRGQLSEFVEKSMYEKLAEYMKNDDGRLQVVGGDFDFRMESLAACIDEAKPDLVVVDGAYLIQTEGQNRTEQAANVFNELKRLANRTRLPIVCSSQFNRQAKKDNAKSASVENIGLTDVAGWNGDLIYGLVQTEDMVNDKRMIMKPLKVREGKGEEFEILWDIDNMQFTELAKGPESVAPAPVGDPFSPKPVPKPPPSSGPDPFNTDGFDF